MNSKEIKKQEVSLVLLGETGAGKTTLLKGIGDHIKGTLFSNRQQTIRTELNGRSQTKECRQYIFSNDIWIVKIIDTPGLADTEGVKVDKEHLKKIVDFLIKEGEFNAICFLLKKGTNRATLQIQYVMNELKCMLPKDATHNIITCLTFSELPEPDDDTMAVIRDLHLPDNNIICIDNRAYEKIKFDPNSKNGRMIERKLESGYEEAKENIEQLLTEAKKFKAYKSEGIKVLKLKRDKLKEEIALLSHSIDDSTKAEIQLKDILYEINEAFKNVEANKNYKIKTTITRQVPYKINNSITTNCIICNKACHINCSLSYQDDLIGCTVMRKERCTKCGCSYQDHTHLGWDFIIEKEDVFEDDLNKKSRYDEALGQKERLEMQREIVRNKIKEEENSKQKIFLTIRTLYKDINNLALIGHNYVYEDYLRNQEKMLKNCDLPKDFVERKLKVVRTALKEWETFKIALS